MSFCDSLYHVRIIEFNSREESMSGSWKARSGGFKKSYVMLGLFLVLATFVSCNNVPSDHNRKNESQENKATNETNDSDQINTDLALTALFLPEGSGIILCNSRFALCAASLCEVDPKDPSKATCECPVLTGPAIGDSDQMAEFRHNGDTGCAAPGSPYRIWSFFQPRKEIPQAPDFKSEPALGMACPEGKYVNCFGFPCEWDGSSGTATCHCKVVTGAFGTQAGNCDKNNCRLSPLGLPCGAPLDNPPFTTVTQNCPLKE
jgi:hypothetical protein